MGDDLLFAYLPYAAVALLIVVTVGRSAVWAASGRDLAFAEPAFRTLYRGSRAWRFGLGAVVLGHLIAFFVPQALTVWDRVPVRLALLEITGYLAALLALLGLFGVVRARLAGAPGGTRPGLRASLADGLFLTLLAVSLASGLMMAATVRWGSSWYLVTIVPYLRSLVVLHPEVSWVASTLPIVRLHLLSGMALLAVLPFTALVDAVALPLARAARAVAGVSRKEAASRDEVALS